MTGSLSGLTQKPNPDQVAHLSIYIYIYIFGPMWDFELGLSKYIKGLRYSLGPLSHISLYALMLQFNICYYLNCLALMHGLDIKLFLLFKI
jgi:hypothetical protein